jgi:AAA+ ATPase superfamily predicted ATPase
MNEDEASMFVGRRDELSKLERMYQSEKFECAIIYGRRRVGKTALVTEFLKGKPSAYFIARESADNLKWFSLALGREAGMPSGAVFAEWEDAFEAVHEISKSRRFVLAIDEYPFLASSHPPISSILMAHIDQRLSQGKLFLIICGSSVSFMEKEVLGYKSPLYGRRTAQFKIAPFTFFEALPFLSSFEPEDKAIAYGFTDGIPEYLKAVDGSKTIRENINELFTTSGLLAEEPVFLLREELRSPYTYNAIIAAIAGGATRLGEIASKSGVEATQCPKYIKTLESLGIVKKEVPVTEKESSRKTLYSLGDFMFRFWYRFVHARLDAIMMGIFEIEDDEMSTYMGLVYEVICRQFIVAEAKRKSLPLKPGKLGRWWGSNPIKKKEDEVDIICISQDSKSAIFCECKWKNAPAGEDVLIDLKRRAGLFHFENVWFWIFAKSGFEGRLEKLAKSSSNVRLIKYGDMLEQLDSTRTS